ncbi:MAG: hypothetical protein ACJ76Z_09910 [Thermoleophilaceae bacterium]
MVCALAAALLAMPASAAAKHAAPLAGAKLDSVSYTLAINTSRCPGPSDPAARTCGHLNLKSAFQSSPAPAVRRIGGQGKFRSGLRISGTGQSQCSSESPWNDPITLPDGGVEYIGSAIRVASSSLQSTDLLVATGRRGVRFAWPEPLAPSAPCKYFGGMPTAAFPGALPRSPLLRRETFEKRRFAATIEAAGVKFQSVEPDGTYVYGEASWKLVLRYKR